MLIDQCNRIVIKVGSSLIAPHNDGCSSQYLLSIANFIVRCRIKGIQVVLVSSGSVAAGAHLFDDADNVSMTIKKAMAAAGQSEMMATWDKLFDFNTAQLLMTHADLKDHSRYISIRDTLDVLLAKGILPIVNENDAVTTDKLKVGDNDNLSAMVATAANADALIICSDIDGLFTANPNLDPNSTLIKDVHSIDSRICIMASGSTSSVGTGGMITKIEAAEKAAAHGIDTFIINGFKEESFNAILSGENPGTHFHPNENPMHDKLHWFTHTTKAQGELIVDDGFEMEKQDSGLVKPDDLVDICGEFGVGDVVHLRKKNGDKLAKVKTNYSSCFLEYLVKADSNQMASHLDETLEPILSEHEFDMVPLVSV